MILLNNYLPVFKLAIHLSQRTNPEVHYEDFRHQCITSLEQSVSTAEYIECSERERDEAFFATVVWLDEFIMRSFLPYKSRWRAELLQVKYFQTTIGGTEFFQRLSQLEDQHQLARYVYLFCLQQGFQGRYAGQDSIPLHQITQHLRWQCLPEAWVSWPNDAELTPIHRKKNKETFLLRHPRTLMLSGLLLIYLLTLLILSVYFM